MAGGDAPAGYRHIAYEVDEGIATVTLDRPDQLNAFTTTMMHELIDAFDRSDADDAVRAVIVTGRGRAFCAGADLAAGPDTFNASGGRESPVGVGWRDGGGRVALRVFESRKPVIAAINGPAVGVGITMTLPMDIRLAADTARIGFVFARRGLVPEACSSWFLPRVVGISRATEWVFTGRVFPAAEAMEAGLVRSVHPADELLSTARGIAREIADNTAPVSVALSPASKVAPPDDRSAPAQNPRPSPVTTTARTSSSSSAVAIASPSSAPSCAFHAFSLSGRLRVTVATPSVTS